MPQTKRRASSSAPALPPPYAMPVREWDRATELLKMFAMTGFIQNARPSSLLLISEPGSGKTELIDRFQDNVFLNYASDLTSRGLFPMLRLARQGAATHVVATEFQKFFLRKASTAEATLGILCQAMEEGVGKVLIGDQAIDFGGARLGLIGAITHDTAKKWRNPLRELGFWSRCAAFHWEMPLEQLREVMRSITKGDQSDLARVALKVPDKKVTVDFPVHLSEQFENFVFQKFREHTILRVFSRFRTLAMACALLEGRDRVKAADVEKVVAFDMYWSAMER